ncbi:MAG TPA: hypothetical protein VFJ30_18205 [Phycisphaerae bacterium]|nr:hypothetical protein [Phycisphaerae bacterium]
MSILLAQKERWPAANWVWLAALVILTVLSYIARKVAERAQKAEKTEKEQRQGQAPYRSTLQQGPPARPRETRRPAVPVRQARPVPATPPPAPRRHAAGGHGTVAVAPGTITEVHPGALMSQPVLEPIAVSEAVVEPLSPSETPGRLEPAAGTETVIEEIVHRVDLQSRQELVRAVIFAEILGPPKALRDGPEPWEC